MKHTLALLCLLLVAACANKPTAPATRNAAKNSCPQTFVAQAFARLTLVDHLRDNRNSVSFAKVQVLCRQDKRQTTLVKLSFILQLENPPNKQLRMPVLIPLFAALTTDGKTLAARQSQRLKTTFDKKGQAQTSWTLALPPSSSETPTLYLGFEGKNLPLERIRLNP